MKFILSYLLLFLSVLSIAQTNLYVSKAGNDNTGDGSIGNPYATIKKAATIANNPTAPVTIWVRSGTYQNADFTTTSVIPESSYDPQNAGEAIWKRNSTDAVLLNNINGSAAAWITIKPYTGETVMIEGDGDNTVNIRNSSYIRFEGFKIKGVLDMLPKGLAWKYWGTYRYLSGGSYVYGDRKTDICGQYGISPCTDIPPNVFTTGQTYNNLPNINSLNVERPNIFVGKGLLVNLSHHIEIIGNEIYNFPGGGLRVTQSDYVDVFDNNVHHNSSRASVGTHGLVVEGLDAKSGDNSAVRKMTIARNLIYSNYNEIYSWVQSKTLVTTAIDEGKGLALLRTSPSMPENFNGSIRVENNIAYDNGKSGIHTNDVDNAEIINNTVYNNAHTNIYDASISGGNNAGISIQSSNSIKIINNIIVVPNGLTPAVQALSEGNNCTGETVSNNIVFGGATNDFAGGFTITDPKFVDMAANNVRLQATSSAINAALSSVAPTTDYTKTLRDASPDIGAYEYSTVLPIDLVDFKGQNTERGNLLTWQTTSEINAAYFNVERSTNSVNFAKIGIVQAKGSANAYTYLDTTVDKNILYYRLKMIDKDSSFQYSKIISINNTTAILENREPQVIIYPNPSNGKFLLKIMNETEEFAQISVFNLLGKNLYTIQSFLKSDINDINLDICQLPDGIYICEILNNKKRSVLKIKKNQ